MRLYLFALVVLCVTGCFGPILFQKTQVTAVLQQAPVEWTLLNPIAVYAVSFWFLLFRKLDGVQLPSSSE